MTKSIAKKSANLFQEHREELGFVNEAQCREKGLHTIQEDGEIVGAVLYNHCVRKPQTTIYDLCVDEDYRMQGIGTRLVQKVKTESPHDRLIAKCPIDLQANQFYQKTGWIKSAEERGKNRELNVWEYQKKENGIDLIMTISNAGDTAQAILQSPARIGIESSKEWPYDFPPYFLDFPFTDPAAGFDEHLKAVKEYSPKLTVAPDVEKGRKLDRVIRMGNKLLQHSENVILVPKSCHPSNIPDRFRVGLPLANFGSGTPYGIWDYKDCRSVHILGGSPNIQLKIISHLGNVDSVDSYTLGMRAQYGAWDGKAIDAKDMNYKSRLKLSLNNYSSFLNNSKSEEK